MGKLLTSLDNIGDLVCGQAKVAGSNSQPFDDGLEETEASTEHHSDRGAWALWSPEPSLGQSRALLSALDWHAMRRNSAES
jgi:hypothetical protein